MGPCSIQCGFGGKAVGVHMWYEGTVMVTPTPPREEGGLASQGVSMQVGGHRDLLDTGHWSSTATCPRVTPGVKG